MFITPEPNAPLTVVRFAVLPVQIAAIKKQIEEVHAGQRSVRDLGTLRFKAKIESKPTRDAYVTLLYGSGWHEETADYEFSSEVIVLDKDGQYAYSLHAQCCQMPKATKRLFGILIECRRAICIDLGKVVILPEPTKPEDGDELPF